MNHHLGPGRRNVRTISFMMAREYYHVTGIHWIVRSMRSIPVSRDGKDTGPLRKALRKLQQGHMVGIFPEATVSQSFLVKELKTGAVRIAADAGVPLIPIVVWGTQRILAKGRKPDLSRRQRIDIEVDYNVFVDQEAYVTWTNSTGIDIKAELKVFNGGSAPLVTCQTAGCIGDDADRDTGIMYLIYPYSTPGRMDVTNTPNLASAAVDVACTPGYGDAMPGGCGINVTGDTYYNAPTSGPVQQQVNLGSQTNSYYYTITTTKTNFTTPN